MLRHSVESQWRNVDRKFPNFDNDPKDHKVWFKYKWNESIRQWGSNHST